MFTVIFKSDSREKMEKFCNALRVFKMAVSWGGHESLIAPVVSFTEEHEYRDLPWNMVRFYVGLDDPELLIEDIKSAIKNL